MAQTAWFRPATLGLLLAALAGCTVSIEPGLHGKGPPDPAKGPDGPLAGNPVVVGQAPVPRPGGPPGPPGAVGTPGAPGTAADQYSALIQRLQVLEEERRVAAERMLALEKQLRDKDQAVVQTTFEVQESTRQMKKAREDLVRWKSEMNELRGKLRMMEQENRVTLEAILKTLEQYIDREPAKVRP